MRCDEIEIPRTMAAVVASWVTSIEETVEPQVARTRAQRDRPREGGGAVGERRAGALAEDRPRPGRMGGSA